MTSSTWPPTTLRSPPLTPRAASPMMSTRPALQAPGWSLPCGNKVVPSGWQATLIVAADQDEVEGDLRAGRLGCPPCGGVLRPWGHGRSRVLRRRVGRQDRFRVRRARCRGCRVTQTLLPEVSLLRRLDDVETIGAAIEAKAAGQGYGRIAAELERPKDTVQGWLRAFRRAAEAIRAHFTRWAHALDPLLGPIHPAADPVADALSAIGEAARAAVLALGPRPLWWLVSRLSGGVLLCNATRPLPAVP